MGWLVFCKARKYNQFLNVHSVKHLHSWHTTPGGGGNTRHDTTGEVKAFAEETKLQDEYGVCIICKDLHNF